MKITKEIKSELIDILYKKKLIGITHMSPISIVIKKNRKFLLPSTLNDLEEYTKNCCLCEFSKSKSKILFGKGNMNSKIYIIGLNYDYDEDGQFFLLKDMIENTLHLNINDTYMTNILKCCSSKIYDNCHDEVNQCIPYMEQQISIGLPMLIITLGDAFKYMVKTNENINNVTGNLFSYNGIRLVPLMDPEFICKNPSYKEKMYKDLNKIKKIMDEK